MDNSFHINGDPDAAAAPELLAPPLVTMRGITKAYPGIIALDKMELEMRPGSATALVGENGAGKSTLIKILAGAIRPNDGEILLDGRPVRLPSPVAARRQGIAVVHQHSHLIPDLTLAENYALREGYPRRAIGTVDWATMTYSAEKAVHVMIPGLDVSRRAASLSGVEKQMVEISFALAARPRVLILDEPTAILPFAESDRLFRMVRSFLASDGAVLYVSHRLNEVFDLCDQVTVLRDGKLVWSRPIRETNHDDMIRAMVGRGVSFDRDETLIPSQTPLLQVTALTDGQQTFQDVSLQVNSGEILGIYGLVGAGQSELCAALLSLRPATGRITGADNDDLTARSAGSRVRKGLALVPAERLERGMFRQMSVGENMSIASLGQKSILGLIKSREESRANRQSIEELRVKTTGPHKKALQLSGGNQQKVLLARWLQTNPRILVLEEPTQGVDVGAKVEIHNLIREQARKGVAVLLVSSEMPELLALSHRIAIMRQGRLVTEMDGATASEETILKQALPPQENNPTDLTISIAPAPPPAQSPLTRLLLRRETGLFTMLALILMGASLFVENFATWANFRDILKGQGIILLGAMGIGAVIISGAIDISIGAILGLAAFVAAKANLTGLPTPLMYALPLLTGIVLGGINGLLTVFGRVHSIVITLGAMFALQGLMLVLMDSRSLFNLTESLTWLGRTDSLGLPNLALASIIGLLITSFVLRYTVTGRRWYAIGGDRPSAELLGINPYVVIPLAFAFSGLMLGLAGLLQASYYGQVQTTTGRGYELKAIAAAVIGGTHIMGGRGTALGIFLGALLLGVISNLLVFLRIPPDWDNAVTGAVILLAVCADALATRRERSY